jgi:hypothetical protein
VNPLVQPINRASVRVASMPTGGPTLVDMTHRGPWPLPEVSPRNRRQPCNRTVGLTFNGCVSLSR